jgi:hypothetical protein
VPCITRMPSRLLQVAAALKQAEARLAEAVTGAAVALLDSAPADFWQRAQRLQQAAVAAADEVLLALALGCMQAASRRTFIGMVFVRFPPASWQLPAASS